MGRSLGREIACGSNTRKLHNTDLSGMGVGGETSENRATQEIIRL